MELSLQQLTKPLFGIDIDDLLSCWKWCIGEMNRVVLISSMGDFFLLGKDDAIYWLQTDCGTLTKVAENLNAFNIFLTDEDCIDNWFLPLLVEKLILSGKVPGDNEVYSFKRLPILGGDYTVENIEVTNMSVHFSFMGLICEQIKDLPDGTHVTLKVV